MKRGILTFIFILCVFLLNNCKKCPVCDPQTIEAGFRIIDKQSRIDLLFTKKYDLDSIQVYYKENGTNVQLEIFSLIDTANQKLKIYPSGWSEKSISGIKEFYLRLNNADIDTMRLDINIQNSKCCSTTWVRDFKINGETIKEMDDIYGFFRIYEK